MSLGADIGSLSRAAIRFSDGSGRVYGTASPLHQCAGGLSSRFAGQRNQIDHSVQQLQKHGASLQTLAITLRREASDQQRISGDRSNLGEVGSFGRGGAAILGGAGSLPLLRGIPRVAKPRAGLGPLLRGIPRMDRIKPYNVAMANWAERSRRYAEAGRSTIESSQSLVRSFRKAPHGPRTFSGLLKIKLNQYPQRFATKAVSAATKAKYLKSSKGAGKSLLGTAAVLLLTRGDKEGLAKLTGNGLDQVLSVSGALSQANKLRGLTKLTRPVSTFAKVGGAFAIAGGVIGAVDTFNRYKAGQISGKRAVGEGLVNGASIIGGALIFTVCWGRGGNRGRGSSCSSGDLGRGQPKTNCCVCDDRS
jgi:hypothetical protein